MKKIIIKKQITKYKRVFLKNLKNVIIIIDWTIFSISLDY